MDDFTLFLVMVMLGLSGLLFFVSMVSWYRVRHVKFLLVSLAFLAFFFKGVLQLIEFLVQDEKAVMVDFVILILFYVSVVKR